MSHMLQDRIAQVKHRGDLNRSRWNPAEMPFLSGWPLRSYRWWQQQTNYYGRENLCHFVRVVLIWAPLRWVTQPLRWVAISLRRIFGSALVPLFVGILVVMWLANEALLILHHGIGPVLIGNAIFIAAVVVVWGIVRLVRRYKEQLSRSGNWFFGAHPVRLPWLRPWMTLIVIDAALAPFSNVALSLLIVGAGVALWISVIVGLGWLSHEHAAKRERRAEQARVEMFLRELFALLHPDRVGNEQAYQAWRERYIQWRLTQQHDEVSYDMLTDFIKLSWRAYPPHSQARIAVRERERALRTDHAPKRPSRVRRTFTGVGQFFQLIWAFIVIKKWKICPIIQLDEPAR